MRNPPSLLFEVKVALYHPQQLKWCRERVLAHEWGFILMMRMDGEDAGVFTFVHESHAVEFALTWC